MQQSEKNDKTGWATAQGKWGVWVSILPDRENTGNLMKTYPGGVSKHEFPSKTPNWNFALFPTWSSKEFKMEFKWESKLDFMDFLLYFIRIKQNKTMLFYFHECKASANIFCFT